MAQNLDQPCRADKLASRIASLPPAHRSAFSTATFGALHLFILISVIGRLAGTFSRCCKTQRFNPHLLREAALAQRACPAVHRRQFIAVRGSGMHYRALTRCEVRMDHNHRFSVLS